MAPRTRRPDGKPETPADRRFFDLRKSAYTGPIDQDGYAVTTGRAADILHHLAQNQRKTPPSVTAPPGYFNPSNR
jgi:hypothetical protein